jgi:hypothetical protein
VVGVGGALIAATTVLANLATIAAFVGPLLPAGTGPRAPSAAAPAGSPSTAPAPVAGDPECRDPAGRPADCAAAGAGLWLAPPVDCSYPAIVAALGGDPARDSLLLAPTAIPPGCLVRPAGPARSAGASALTLRAAVGGDIAASLRACARTPTGADVSCATPHRVEYVAPWARRTQEAEGGTCSTAAREYTRRQTEGLGERLTVLTLYRGGGEFRCAVQLDRGRLVSSVRDLGDNDLPLAR